MTQPRRRHDDGDPSRSIVAASATLIEAMRARLNENSKTIERLEAGLAVNGQRIATLMQELDVIQVRYLAATEEILLLRRQLREALRADE